MVSLEAFSLEQIFAVLTPRQSVDTVAVSPSLYGDLDEHYNGFRGHTLVAVHEFSEPWGMWEMHPAGDEIVVLLSGRVRFRVRQDSGEEAVELAAPGEYVVVPQNRWHTAEARTQSKLLFITPGEGTVHDNDS